MTFQSRSEKRSETKHSFHSTWLLWPQKQSHIHGTDDTTLRGLALRITTAAALVLSVISVLTTASLHRSMRREIESTASLHTVRQIRADLDATRAQVEFEAAKRTTLA